MVKQSSVAIEKSIQINSLKQQIIDKDHLVFEGEVEVLFDKKFHIWADRVEVDYTKKVLRAFCNVSCAIKVETKDFLLLAQSFELDLQSRVGSAKKIKIHTADGYFSARYAEKIGDYEWYLHHVSYTACDADNAHWQITAREASVCAGCFIKVNWVFFKIGPIPVFVLPKMIIPLQTGFSSEKKGAASGFMIPKFYFDYDSGFGFKQEYYHHFGDRCDTTLGVEWREQKGIALFDEFRWVRAPGSYTQAKAYYALARHDFKESQGKILPAIRNRYWVSGKDFFSYDLFGAQGNNLIKLDFGTDKRIGYQFFELLEQVDDSFYNALINRLLWPKCLLQLKVDDMQTSRKRFSALSEDDLQRKGLSLECLDQNMITTKKPFNVKELENRVSVALAPAISLHSAYHVWANKLFYRQDFFFDQILYREQELVKTYCDSFLIDEDQSIPLKKAQIMRFDYRGALESSTRFYGNTFTGGIYPTMQGRSLIQENQYLYRNVYESRLFARGASRLFLTYGAEWSLPEVAFSDYVYDYLYSLQPLVRWDYVPLFKQQHWYFMDERDFIFPKNQIEASLTQHFMKGSSQIEFSVSQGYEFNKSEDILPLRRSLGPQHFLPIQVRAQVNNSLFQGTLQQEYDVKNAQLLNTEIITGISVHKVHFNMGYLFQPPSIQRTRELFSNVSHFVLVDFMVPVGKSSTIQYAGQFYVEKGHRFMELANVKPLLHTLRFEYTGHCCGFYVGYEEKKYREFGHDKHERAIVFSLRLNSLGSLAKRFKRPQVMDNSKINDEGLYGLS